MTCIDCGTSTTPTVDGLPLCTDCLALAITLVGSGQARVAQLKETHAHHH